MLQSTMIDGQVGGLHDTLNNSQIVMAEGGGSHFIVERDAASNGPKNHGGTTVRYDTIDQQTTQ